MAFFKKSKSIDSLGELVNEIRALRSAYESIRNASESIDLRIGGIENNYDKFSQETRRQFGSLNTRIREIEKMVDEKEYDAYGNTDVFIRHPDVCFRPVEPVLDSISDSSYRPITGYGPSAELPE